jgi:hypothetical protein
MSTEYEDVLTNQPVVIDNVRIDSPISPYNISLCSLPFLSFFFLSIGLGNNQSRIRRPGSSKMLFPLIVRPVVAFVCGGARGGLTHFFFFSFEFQQCRAAEAYSGYGGCS